MVSSGSLLIITYPTGSSILELHPVFVFIFHSVAARCPSNCIYVFTHRLFIQVVTVFSVLVCCTIVFALCLGLVSIIWQYRAGLCDKRFIWFPLDIDALLFVKDNLLGRKRDFCM